MSIQATLVTRCGCSKTLDISELREIISMVIRRDMQACDMFASQEEPTYPSLNRRDFKLVAASESKALYQEVLP